MLDARMQARLTQNYKDAAVGYANASAAAMNAFAQQAMDFWAAPMRAEAVPAPRRDHLSWFNPTGATSHWGMPVAAPRPAPVNPWLALMPWAQFAAPAAPPTPVFNPWLALTPWAQPQPAARSLFQPPANAQQLTAMSWAFAPFAVWWGAALRGPTFAWPMAYSMIAQGVPDSVAWPTAEANAAVIDATAIITEQAQQSFASYQSAGGFAMAHVWAPKTLSAFAALTPMMAMWPGQGTQSTFF